ncbi:hypothetical protein BDP27DRAFT_1431467 [Rhodocollybia butyracea]|uniref:Uncharacterized protein n=1 Tax=Rhodocollybia butyracea TaxID=206335 RepID=A0A9P5P9E6_9AGAR|nr:hypothetical protein BDP27DRAFT_1431467 [Rhodocollybia butyracea]
MARPISPGIVSLNGQTYLLWHRVAQWPDLSPRKLMCIRRLLYFVSTSFCAWLELDVLTGAHCSSCLCGLGELDVLTDALRSWLRTQVELDVLTGALCSYLPVQLYMGLVNPTTLSISAPLFFVLAPIF